MLWSFALGLGWRAVRPSGRQASRNNRLPRSCDPVSGRTGLLIREVLCQIATVHVKRERRVMTRQIATAVGVRFSGFEPRRVSGTQPGAAGAAQGMVGVVLVEGFHFERAGDHRFEAPEAAVIMHRGGIARRPGQDENADARARTLGDHPAFEAAASFAQRPQRFSHFGVAAMQHTADFPPHRGEVGVLHVRMIERDVPQGFDDGGTHTYGPGPPALNRLAGSGAWRPLKPRNPLSWGGL